MKEDLQAKKALGMRSKLILLFVLIKIMPLVLLAFIAWWQFQSLSSTLQAQTITLAERANKALNETKETTIQSTKDALEANARENIERMTTDAATVVAEFLYSRDADAITVSKMKPARATYQAFIEGSTRRILRQGEWVLNKETDIWEAINRPASPEVRESSIKANAFKFHYRPRDMFTYTKVPLFREITFIDLNGQEKIKVTASSIMDKKLKNVSLKRNTFIKAEDYFKYLPKLKKGEIYVSDVIGEYVPSKIIGIYNKSNADKKGIKFDPKSAAFSGWENPVGKRFEGIVRWATPVYENNRKIGYITLALNHDHLLELMAHITPSESRYSELSDAFAGNYAFIWDYKGRSVVHPRHHSIVGFDSKTGDPAVPWLEDKIYERWMASGKSYAEYIVDEPTFVEQSTKKRPSLELTKNGYVGLDCRYLNQAPQCTGWFDLASDGGSGSFVILWSGLTKLTTAAAIPYYTGHYANSRVGFGFVAIGAGLDFFLLPATETGEVIDGIITQTNAEIEEILDNTHAIISASLTETATSLIVSTLLMTFLVIFVAIWLANTLMRRITFISSGMLRFRNGERHFRFNEPVHDEIGVLYESFNTMADNIEQSVTEVFCITNLQSEILYANDVALKSMEISFDEAVGHNYEKISSLGVLNPLSKYHAGLPQAIEFQKSTQRYIKGKVENFYNVEGIHTGYIVTISDVTDFVLKQQETELQRRLLMTIFAASPDLIWYKNAENTYLAVNPRFSSVSNRVEIEGALPETILSENALTADVSNDNKARQSKRAVYSEEEYTFSDGHKEILEIVRTPIYNENNEFDGIVAVARDMSDRVNIERRLRETQIGLEKAILDANKANAAKSAFLARMSHEIRTPMNAILGMSTVAQDSLEQPNSIVSDVREHVEQIEISAKHLLSLVNEILETSRIDSTGMNLRSEIFDLGALIKDVATILRDVMKSVGVELILKTPHLAGQHFLSDPLKLRQVLINLLTNAIQQSPSKGVVTLTIGQEQVGAEETRFLFTILDNGEPMEKAKFEAINVPFEMNENMIDAQQQDPHFSLTLSQQIVYHLGGKIVAETIDAGNKIMFTVCLKEVQKTETQETKEDLDLSVLTGKRIMVVDDVEINRIILIKLLSGVSVSIDEAENGAVALELYQNSSLNYYDLIFMDLQMPVMNGFEATSNIRKLDRPDAKNVPILAVTANSFPEDIEKTIQSGMNAHFAKPVNRDNLMSAMVKLFNAQSL